MREVFEIEVQISSTDTKSKFLDTICVLILLSVLCIPFAGLYFQFCFRILSHKRPRYEFSLNDSLLSLLQMWTKGNRMRNDQRYQIPKNNSALAGSTEEQHSSLTLAVCSINYVYQTNQRRPLQVNTNHF